MGHQLRCYAFLLPIAALALGCGDDSSEEVGAVDASQVDVGSVDGGNADAKDASNGDATTSDADSATPVMDGGADTGDAQDDGATTCPSSMPSVTVWLVGDSTVASGSGWGDSFQDYLIAQAVVQNRAVGGRSSKSFYEEENSRWNATSDAVMNNIHQGDYVLIQFGHNDEKDDAERHTDPGTAPDYQGSYRTYLELYLSETRAKQATPILVTSVSRMIFNGDELSRSHGEYPKAMRKVALDNDVVLLDLEEESYQVFSALGQEQTLELFAGQVDGGSYDLTHFPPAKAWRVAEMVKGLLAESQSPLRCYLSP